MRSNVSLRPRAAITCGRSFKEREKGQGKREKGRCCCSDISIRSGRWGQLETMPVREEGGRLHGPGIFDMKSWYRGCHARDACARGVDARRRCECRDAVDDGRGDWKRDVARADRGRGPQEPAVLVLEPSLPGGAVKTRRKGSASSSSRCTALPHTRGSIRARERAPFTSWRSRLLPSKRFRIRSAASRVNVGTISGGSRTNVVADRASRVDRRARADDGGCGAVDAAIRALRPAHPAVRLENQGGRRPAAARTDRACRPSI